MKFIADFHIHSHFSIATSKQLVPEYLDYWARLKGITVVGSGDFTHPGWVKELQEKLEPAEEGLFKLKSAFKQDNIRQTPFLPEQEVRFMLTAEISNIYKKKDRVRKVHNVIFAPDFETVEKIRQKLTGLGANITSDGRPIIGLDAKDLLELVLDCSDRVFFVPAHIWTPWFSVLGDKSGFESIEECFDDLSEHIYAVETGLSSDPPMNRMCGFLDRYTLVSNSDAHSPEKLGRNANLFDTELSYSAITGALKSANPEQCLGTIDLFPQEGKYHYDGHRKCGICWNPVDTLKHQGICPECGKPVTVGVMNRVARISDREDPGKKKNRLPFYSIIPLKEILSELVGVSPNSKKVDREYFSLLKKGHPELQFLLDVPVEEITVLAGEEVAEAVRRMRNREIFVKEGFDGEYGRINVFRQNEKKNFSNQKTLFTGTDKEPETRIEPRKMINFDLQEYRKLARIQARQKEKTEQKFLDILNLEQRQAAQHFAGPALIIAGPGTGKTRVLAFRIIQLIKEKNIKPENILAVTFTNRAAAEMKERVESLPGDREIISQFTITTFHALGLSILKELLGNENKITGRSETAANDVSKRFSVQKKFSQKNQISAHSIGISLREEIGRDKHFSLIGEEDRKWLLRRIPGCEKGKIKQYSEAITLVKQEIKPVDEIDDPELAEVYKHYETLLKEYNCFDLDDLIYLPVKILDLYPEVRDHYRDKYHWIMVDEYQDINYAQYRLLMNLVSAERANLCVIGDPDQAIYGFRGADVGFIKKFTDDFPGAALYRLKKSYRCSDSILRASGDVMRKGERAGETLSGLGKGVKIRISRNHTHKSEAEFVARTIEGMMGGLRFFSMDSSISQGNQAGEIESLSDFAVLCRMKGQFEAVEKAFKDHAIPYQNFGEQAFFKQEPVCSIIDILRLLQNPANNLLKEKLIASGGQGAHMRGEAFIASREVVCRDGPKGLPEKFLAPPFLKKVDRRRQEHIKDTIAFIIDNYFAAEKKENESAVTRLVELAGNFGSDLDEFLKFTVLGTGMDMYKPGLENVTLLTLHAAKGLEFKCVFIIGCEDGLLPYSLYESQTCDHEEERRLLYVGMTRAKEFLFLCHADKRFIRGREFRLKRSSFLDPIEKELIELSQMKERKQKEREPIQRSLFGDEKG